MTSADVITLALTVVGVGGMLMAARYLKPRLKLPAVSPWLAMGAYNSFWAVLLLAERYTALALPTILAPVAIVGGNGVLVSFFGMPALKRRPQSKAVSASGRRSDPDRQPLTPKSKKKRRHKRR